MDPTPSPSAAPSLFRQKTFIVENAGILDFEARREILHLVMMEIGRAASAPGADAPVILENLTTGAVSINLDNIEAPELVLHIYNIVRNRRAALNEPAGPPKR
jgi:hypothetical protein